MNVNSPVFIPHIIVDGRNLPITNTLLVTPTPSSSLPNRWRRVDHTSPTSTMPLLINELDKLRQQQKQEESKQKQQKSKQKQQSSTQQKQYKNYIVTSNQLNYQYLLNNQSIETINPIQSTTKSMNLSEQSFDHRTIEQELLKHKVQIIPNQINNDDLIVEKSLLYQCQDEIIQNKSQNITDEHKVPSETDVQSDHLLLQNDDEFWQLPLKEQLLHQLKVHQDQASQQQRNQKEEMYQSLQEQFWQQLMQQCEYDDTVQHNSSNKVGHNKNNEIPSTINNQQQKFNNHNNTTSSKSNKSSGRTTTTSSSSAKRANYNKNNKSHHHNHPWLASNIKGHTDEIRDIDFSSNGKFLASCAEDNNSSNNNNTSNTTGDNHQQQHQHHETRHLHRGIIRHNNVHRNSTTSTSSTDSTADGSGSSDDINCSSSNEDISVHMYEPIKLSNHKKSSKNGRNRQQRQRQRQLKIINTTSTTTTMEIDDELKENRNPLLLQSSLSSSSSTTTTNKILSSSSSSTASSSSVVATRKQYKNSSIISTSLTTPLKSINSSLSSSSSKQQQQQQNYHINSSSSKISISTAEIEEIVNMNRRTTKSLLPSTLPLNIDENDLVKFLRYYVIDPNLLRIYGYPVESIYHDGSIEIFKCLSRPFTHYKTNGKFKKKCRSSNNNNNIELINNNKHVNIINENDGLLWSSRNLLSSSSSDSSSSNSCMQISSGDSGQGDSGSSSPPSVIDSDTSEENCGDDNDFTTTFYTPDGNYQIFNNYNQFGEKQCVRCNRNFILSENGKYLTKEECNYHWGRPYQVYISGQGITNFVNCCNREQNSFGCCNNYVHVWTGVTVGINGPFNDYVQTTKNYLKLNNNEQKKQQIINNNNNNLNIDSLRKNKVYAIDCEMCFTATGLDVGKITIISIDGKLAYEQYIKPNMEIVDYNTRFSGITENDLSINNPNVKTLKQVQNDLLQFINTDTILIGHALDNDLRALKILHKNVIDTSITFPHMSGFPYRRSLKHLTKNCLGRDIQTGEYGHCSFEDSQACLELILWRVQKDFELATTTTTTPTTVRE